MTKFVLGRYCTEKVDVYSFGVIMWEVASHEQPSRGRMRNLKVPEEVPAAIDALISRCMSEDPETRPTAKEAYDILRDWRDRQVEFLQQRKQSMDLRNLDAQGGKQDSPASPRTSNGLGSGLASLQSGSTASGDTSTQLS